MLFLTRAMRDVAALLLARQIEKSKVTRSHVNLDPQSRCERFTSGLSERRTSRGNPAFWQTLRAANFPSHTLPISPGDCELGEI
jgi:hypothetical protein